MTDWTRDMVEERVEEAAWVLERLPGPRRQGYFSTWPDIVLSAREIASQEPRPMRVLPSPQAITRMEEAITWNQYLERDDANLMWERAGECRGSISATASASAGRPRPAAGSTRSASSPGGSTAGR
jgi:hypothetical protein